MLKGPFERLRGLLGTDGSAQAVALMGCSSIHTYGMRYRIDVAFVDIGGLVVASWWSVPPGRMLSNKHAYITLERPHERSPWLVMGEQVEMEHAVDVLQATGSLSDWSSSDSAP